MLLQGDKFDHNLLLRAERTLPQLVASCIVQLNPQLYASVLKSSDFLQLCDLWEMM
jgi:hypothetical protein